MMSTSTRFTLLLAVPMAFVAGIVAMALLARTGVVAVNSMQTGALHDASKADTGLVGSVNNQAGITQSRSWGELNQRLDELELQIQTSTKQSDLSRAQIDKKFEALESQLEQSIAAADASTDTPINDQDDDNLTIATGEQSNGFTNRRFGPADGQEQYDNLLLAGVDPYVAQEIQQRNDQWSLARLELLDQATREGWRDSDQFNDQLQELRDTRPDIRSELGDDDYDRYLYASGDSNRVAVSSIINGSAAQQSGMQNGDVVVSYANSRVFGTRELQSATRDGQRGESVQVEVLRNGQVITVDVPRGPLGITLTGSRVAPPE